MLHGSFAAEALGGPLADGADGGFFGEGVATDDVRDGVVRGLEDVLCAALGESLAPITAGAGLRAGDDRYSGGRCERGSMTAEEGTEGTAPPIFTAVACRKARGSWEDGVRFEGISSFHKTPRDMLDDGVGNSLSKGIEDHIMLPTCRCRPRGPQPIRRRALFGTFKPPTHPIRLTSLPVLFQSEP